MKKAQEKVSGKKTKKTSGGLLRKVEKSIFRSSPLSVISGAALGIFIVSLICSVDIITGFLPEITFSDEENIITDTDSFEEFIEVIEPGEEEVAVETLNELRSEANLSSILKTWAENTSENTLMKSKDVINILLIGLDKNRSNSDAIIIASLNKTEKKIFLHSVFRDSYTYINTKFGDKYSKINACYANGGAEKLTETIEGNFKIDIDYYVSVDFNSFRGIVDSFDGINLDVKEYEAREIERETGRSCPFGSGVLLDGEQALTFCRIRQCDVDADISRTRRQRQFINKLISLTGDISITQLPSLLDTVINYVDTDCSLGQLISLGSKAISEKWYNFEIVSDAVPKENHRLDYRGSSWVWIVDYPLAAADLHNTVYGTTNIVLEENRVSAVDIMRNLSVEEKTEN